MSEELSLEALYEGIGLQEEMRERLCGLEKTFPMAEYEAELNALTDPDTAEGAMEKLLERLGEDPGHVRMLLCYLEAACRVYGKYRAAGIEDRVFFDTMKVFSRFIGECRRKTGRYDYDRVWWNWRQVSMRLFRLGELEYEPGQDGQRKVMAVHIPSDARFDAASVDASLQTARDFFARFMPEWADCPYRCHSWLLSPLLRELLGPDSNILRFQSRFEIVRVDEDDRGFLQWIYDVPDVNNVDVSGLPEDTSLRRAVKEALLQGKSVGAAVGYLRG